MCCMEGLQVLWCWRSSTRYMCSTDLLSLPGKLCCHVLTATKYSCQILETLMPCCLARPSAASGTPPTPASANASAPQRRSRAWRGWRCWGFGRKNRGRSFLECCKCAVLPGPVQGLVIRQQAGTLQESCQHHVGACSGKGLEEQGLFGVLVVCQPVAMHLSSF